MCKELVERLRAGTYTVKELSIIIPKAADAIEELQQTVDHYKGCSDDWYKEACDYKAMLPAWIPVTERLPEEDEEVLVVAVSDFNRNDRWVAIDWLYCGEWQQHSIVTHWMPLPEPPKAEGELDG